MFENQTQAIEFHGGPLDGHLECFGPSLQSFVVVKTTIQAEASPRVLRRFLRLLRGVLLRREQAPYVWAVYELKTQGCKWGYYYLHSSLANHLSPTSVHVRIVVSR